ncbi:hypothetical protein KC333_g9 [Hortaea werneckii]|nr:hypothetical protein KC333_g9 [Hortaea werneckii]
MYVQTRRLERATGDLVGLGVTASGSLLANLRTVMFRVAGDVKVCSAGARCADGWPGLWQIAWQRRISYNCSSIRKDFLALCWTHRIATLALRSIVSSTPITFIQPELRTYGAMAAVSCRLYLPRSSLKSKSKSLHKLWEIEKFVLGPSVPLAKRSWRSAKGESDPTNITGRPDLELTATVAIQLRHNGSLARSEKRHSLWVAFSRDFKKTGYIPLSTYMKTYKVGDIVDVVCNGAVQKGMPFKVRGIRTSRAGGKINPSTTVRNRYIEKRINVRIEHVRHSRSREEFINRVKTNAEKKRQAKEKEQQAGVDRTDRLRHAHLSAFCAKRGMHGEGMEFCGYLSAACGSAVRGDVLVATRRGHTRRTYSSHQSHKLSITVKETS